LRQLYLGFRKNKGKTPSKGTREGKKKGPESKQKTIPESAKPKMGSPEWRDQIT
jgi:hypothetical protein